MLRIYIWVFLLLTSFAEASQVSVPALIEEAKVNNALSDHYRSMRALMFLRKNRPKSFFEAGFSTHIDTLSALDLKDRLAKDCDLIQKYPNATYRASGLYKCGQVYFEKSDFVKAEKYLSSIPNKSKESNSAKVILASIALAAGEGEKCIKLLDPKSIKVIKTDSARDLMWLTRARCSVQINKYLEAISDYQEIRSTGALYLQAVEETAWAQFKIRNLESARTLLDVIVVQYESNPSSIEADANTYFRSRYLQGYIELVEKNYERSEILFSALARDVFKYRSQLQLDEKQIALLMKQVIEGNIKWLDIKSQPPEWKRFMNLAKSWADARSRKRMDALLELIMAHTREIKSVEQNQAEDFKEYLAQLKKLNEFYVQQLRMEVMRAARAIDRFVKVLEVKAEMGKVELVWSKRAEGVRNVNELLESYQIQVQEVEEYF